MHGIVIIICLLRFSSCENDVSSLFEEINKNVVKLNAIAAEIEWASSINDNTQKLKDSLEFYQKNRILWQRKTCDKLAILQNRLMLNQTQKRQAFLLCRQPAYKVGEARSLYELNEKMQSTYYNAEVCIPRAKFLPRSPLKMNLTDIENAIIIYLSTEKQNFKFKNVYLDSFVKRDVLCLKQNDLEKLTAYSKKENVLRWIWLAWREETGPLIKYFYNKLINIENKAARRNGYADIGEYWRAELEIPNLKYFCHRLYKSILPLYMLLHGVVRYYLKKKYGDIVPARGPIPSHLLGNLWNQNWEPLTDLIIPNTISLDENMKNMNWNVKHMVKRTEDFYLSLGLPAMTDTFWRNSVFTQGGHGDLRCHGTAADMFKKDDFRLLYCSGISLQDFNVLHHEIGHIQYYMAYAHQPGIFRQANSALHETIGEAVMIGVVTPQHLNRLGLINDSILYSTGVKNNAYTLLSTNLNENAHYKSHKSTNIPIKGKLLVTATNDEILLLKRALSKLPQIPFSLLIDEYRWRYFEGSIERDSLNKEFWAIALELQGISPPEERGEDFFDVGAIYHVADNTPYIRYFLSSFIQHQLFENFCKVAVFGNQQIKEPLPSTILLNECDIYGAKNVGKMLKNLMSRGNSQQWREILWAALDEHDISPEPLLRYYRPLQDFLTRLVIAYEIPIGW
ncbi:unnamed protein product [Parnassius mnemosyne]|uniref:Angiotensin-converting enzyme n=1 Tax=Parnassius mnemosyne TaxID=213953 RepID=A0AAV1LHQ9_9NEOP